MSAAPAAPRGADQADSSSGKVSRGEGLALGRYVLCREVARGGMASVYVGRLRGAKGFTRTVAIKRLHAQLATDHDFVTMFLDEARLASRVRHPNVIPTLDAVALEDELFLVMEYVEGASLAHLMRSAERKSPDRPAPLAVLCAIMSDALQGLQAAHEAKDEQGAPLGIVHRDVSPQNILVGTDGTARVLDFGVAKAMGRLHTTRDGELKGKLAYMAPEQILAQPIDLRVDVFAAGIVLWELATGRRLFYGQNEGEVVHRLLSQEIPVPSSLNPNVPAALDAVIMRALKREPAERYASAADFGAALDEAVAPATARQVGDWVRATDGEAIAKRAADVAAVEAEEFEEATRLRTRDAPLAPAPPRVRRGLLTAVMVASGLAVAALGWWATRARSIRAEEANAPAAASSSAAIPPILEAPSIATAPASAPGADSAASSRPSGTPSAAPSSAISSAATRHPLPSAPRRPPPAPSAKPSPTSSAPLYTRD